MILANLARRDFKRITAFVLDTIQRSDQQNQNTTLFKFGKHHFHFVSHFNRNAAFDRLHLYMSVRIKILPRLLFQ